MTLNNATEIEIKEITLKPPISKSTKFSSLRPVDLATFIYLTAVAIILSFFHRGVPDWYLLVPGHFLFIFILYYFIKFAHSTNSKILKFLWDWYPVLLYTFFFKEINYMMNSIFPFWLEPWLLRFDYWLFGTYPAIWLRKYYQPWLVEFMSFSYWIYYILFPIAGIIFYFNKNKKLFQSFIFHLSLTLYVCYLSYPFLTARSPHETLPFLQLQHLDYGFFTKFVRIIQAQAHISGAAFPSSHVAAVWIILFFMIKYKPRLGWFLIPLIFCLTISVVFLQYHYVLDPIGGILVAFAIYSLASFVEKRINPYF